MITNGRKSHGRPEIYTIFNFGTPHSFNPQKRVIDYFTNKESTLLAVHQQKVREANHPLVFIVNNRGERLAP